jgi:hypothetical protein
VKNPTGWPAWNATGDDGAPVDVTGWIGSGTGEAGACGLAATCGEGDGPGDGDASACGAAAVGGEATAPGAGDVPEDGDALGDGDAPGDGCGDGLWRTFRKSNKFMVVLSLSVLTWPD